MDWYESDHLYFAEWDIAFDVHNWIYILLIGLYTTEYIWARSSKMDLSKCKQQTSNQTAHLRKAIF